MDFLIVWLLNGFALMVVAYLLKDVHIEDYFSAFIAAAVLALVNTLVKPVLVVLTIPISILTLGLFLLVINAFLFWLVSKMLKGFEVRGAVAFFLGPILYSIISSVLSYIFLG
ncbi:MAG: phage holin family protein [Alcaligenaceae bacterium]|nr:phage holin family protein [Alcaligenaceae bacterium]